MASPSRRIDKATAIRVVRELVRQPDASDGEILELTQEAIAKVEGERVSIDLKVNSCAQDALLRRLFGVLLRENHSTGEGKE